MQKWKQNHTVNLKLCFFDNLVYYDLRLQSDRYHK